MNIEELKNTPSAKLVELVLSNDVELYFHGNRIGSATKTIDDSMKVSKVITYSAFSRGDKKEFLRALKRGAVKIICGYGRGNEKSIYFVK